MFWLALIVYAFFDVIATWATIKWLHLDNKNYLAIGFICYVIDTVAWLIGIGAKSCPGIARAYAIYPIWAMLVGVLAALLIAEEQLMFKDWLGIILGIIALALLSY